VDVVVVVGSVILIGKEFVQVPVEVTVITVALSGTEFNVYPATNADFKTPVANGVPDIFENILNGPVSAPGFVNVTMTIIVLYLKC
jgi:hypothetical protein